MPAPMRKPPQQDRSRKAEKALLLAGLRGIETRGVAALNMAEVAAEARASIGSLYFRFGDKSQFVGAVLAVALEEFHDRGFAMCETAEREKWPERRVLEGWVSIIVASARERRTLLREIISHMAAHPEAWKPIHERRRQVEDRLLSVLSARSGNGSDPDSQDEAAHRPAGRGRDGHSYGDRRSRAAADRRPFAEQRTLRPALFVHRCADQERRQEAPATRSVRSDET